MKHLTTLLLLSLTLILSANAWADGPEYNDIELAKKSITDCSGGVEQIWNYEPYGKIFYGKNIDLPCLEGMEGIPSYKKAEEALVIKGDEFWFFIDSDSYGTSIQVDKYGIIAQHSHMQWTGNYLIQGVLNAQSQEDINSIKLMDGGYELHEDYYISKMSKSYKSKEGGAFWYDSKRDYDNQILELIDIKEKTKYGVSCITFEEALETSGYTFEEVQEFINPETGKSKWWLAALSYHDKPTWCYTY